MKVEERRCRGKIYDWISLGCEFVPSEKQISANFHLWLVSISSTLAASSRQHLTRQACWAQVMVANPELWEKNESGLEIAGRLFLKLPKHAESSYAMDATRNAAGAASAEGLIYNALLFVTLQDHVQTNFHLLLTYY